MSPTGSMRYLRCAVTLPSGSFLFVGSSTHSVGFPHGAVVKSPSINARDAGLIRGAGRSPGVGNDNFFSILFFFFLSFSILTWKILWTEEPGGLQSMGSQRVGHD